MDLYNLDINTNNVGGYFSSEQLELLSIIQCQTYDELLSFIKKSQQLSNAFSKEEWQKFSQKDIEDLKRFVFKRYQDTLVPHDSDKSLVIDNTLKHLDLKEEDINVIKKVYTHKSKEAINYIRDYIKNRYPNNYEDIFKKVHEFISLERDQNKMPNLYDELVTLNEKLEMFDTLLIGSGKPEVVVNEFFADDNPNEFDYYFAQNDLDFAYKNNKHVRFHSLLTKGASESLFKGKDKEEILKILTSYVKRTIDFVSSYNSSHKLEDGKPVIEAIDLFNEIISFDKNKDGLYENIWETQYGISIKDICDAFTYAKSHKPEGVSYLYNEPFLEDPDRRVKVMEVLKDINLTSGGLIDTLGTQMHITFRTSDDQIKEAFKDFKTLQDEQNMNIQITEFDLSLGEREVLRVMGEKPEFSYEQIYEMKKERINRISSLINDSGVNLSGVSYWSLTDNIDCNLERVRTSLLNKGIIKDIKEVTTVCGGLMPTYQEYLNLYDNNYSKKL